MATTLRAQVTFERQNQQPIDVIVNTWHFRTDEPDPLDGVTDAALALADFYGAIDSQLSSIITGNGLVKWYNLLDPEPRVPIQSTVLALATATGTPLPAECAVVLSYQGLLESGQSQRRRRGRIFLGPFDGTALDEAASDGRVQASTMEAIGSGVDALDAALQTTNTRWAVFSPTTAGAPPWTAGELTAATNLVATWYVDNAWDTMRSRGLAPNDRLTGTITIV